LKANGKLSNAIKILSPSSISFIVLCDVLLSLSYLSALPNRFKDEPFASPSLGNTSSNINSKQLHFDTFYDYETYSIKPFCAEKTPPRYQGEPYSDLQTGCIETDALHAASRTTKKAARTKIKNTQEDHLQSWN
jgi:hypothetical protein